MTINPEIFFSVLAALFAYGLSKHLLVVVLGHLWGKQPVAATNHQVGRSALQNDTAV